MRKIRSRKMEGKYPQDGRWKIEDGRWRMRSRKMEGKDPQEGGWSTETGLWPHLIPLEYQTYPAANK